MSFPVYNTAKQVTASSTLGSNKGMLFVNKNASDVMTVNLDFFSNPGGGEAGDNTIIRVPARGHVIIDQRVQDINSIFGSVGDVFAYELF